MLNMFKDFLADNDEQDMYITGRAGTGKTTDVAELVAYCLAMEIDCVVTAYTHKACGILSVKMPENTVVKTLHSFLRKCPTVDGSATNKKYIESNTKTGESEKVTVMFIDEYSMVGERDSDDIDLEKELGLKVVWIGDNYQLPPVKDKAVIKPQGSYQILLREVKRQAKDNPLGAALEQLVSFIDGEDVVPLVTSTNLVRGCNIVKDYCNLDEPDKIILAYTNKRVQELNSLIMDRTEPQKGDILFSPTTQQRYIFDSWCPNPTCIDLHFGDQLTLGTKYKTLENLTRADIAQFANIIDEDGEELTVACLFGHYSYKSTLDHLKGEAALANKNIESRFKFKAAQWARINYTDSLAKKRAKAWSNFLGFNQCAICLDFAHAQTVHKSQGSTYNTVFLDTNDLYIAANFSFVEYLKLMYVALSRASNKVITN